MTHAEKKHRKQLKRNEKKRKYRKNIALLNINVSDASTIYNSKPHPIQRTRKESILSIHKAMRRKQQHERI